MSKIRRYHLKVLYISYKGLLTIIERSIYNLNQSNKYLQNKNGQLRYISTLVAEGYHVCAGYP